MSESIRNLTWKLNWWRQSELEGALLLGRMVGLSDSAQLCLQLTRHCSDEAAHSLIWAETLRELNLPYIEIRKSYQSFFLRHTGLPASLLEVLAFTQIFERRVHRRFIEELRHPGTPAAVRRSYERMIDDEKGHLAWVAQWLAQNASSDEQLRRFEATDQLVLEELLPFEDHLWEISGLGRDATERIAA